MTYVIWDPCIGTKDASCVEVCPVDCIHPTRDEPDFEAVDQLFVDPTACIDCDACVEACPVQAVLPEASIPDDMRYFITKNAAYFGGEDTTAST